MKKEPAVYILASRCRGTLYTGVTSDLTKRCWEHKNNIFPGFTQKYNIHTLVYFEIHESMGAAISREKEIKKWGRAVKMALIEKENPSWEDLWPTLL